MTATDVWVVSLMIGCFAIGLGAGFVLGLYSRMRGGRR